MEFFYRFFGVSSDIFTVVLTVFMVVWVYIAWRQIRDAKAASAEYKSKSAEHDRVGNDNTAAIRENTAAVRALIARLDQMKGS